MELKFTPDYEELAIAWQYHLITLLKQKMEQFDVEPETAKEIIGEFIFDMSILHDQEAIQVNGDSYNPRICFDDFAGNLLACDVETNLHDTAFGNTGEAYAD